MALDLEYTSYTEIGARPNNEDYCTSHLADDWGIFVVADGVGGYPGGEFAAQYFCQIIVELAATRVTELAHRSQQAMQQLITDAANGMSTKLNHEGFPDAATTCALVWLNETKVVTAHIGDSRIYFLDRERVYWRSKDHSRVQELVDEGIISETEMGTHPEQWELYRSISAKQTPQADVFIHTPLESGQLLLLCSDGFWQITPPSSMLSLCLAHDFDAELIKLTQHAVRKAGSKCDNVTALAIRHK